MPHVVNSENYDSKTLLKYNNGFPLRFYRKDIIKKVGGYSNDLTSAVDFDLMLKIDEITKIHRIKYPITYYYRQHSKQVSTQFRIEQDLNAKQALQNALDRRFKNGILLKQYFVINNKPPFKISE